MDQIDLISKQIKEYAKSIGFDICKICFAEDVEQAEKQHLQKWVENEYQGNMEYLRRNLDKRVDPTLLVENAKSIICLALNYYPTEKQSPSSPQFAYYAYGQDYHDVMKAKMQIVFDYIKKLLPNTTGRIFVDTAPVMERYWATKAGVGFTGKNTLLIIPKKGSFFFIGEIIIDSKLNYDTPLGISCGSCTRCIDACPTKALVAPYVLDATKCISYQTIENKGDIPLEIIFTLHNQVYGCDICQKVCPWNKFAKPHTTKEFVPHPEFLTIDYNKLEQMTEDDYRRIFKGSAIKRAKYSGLKRNLDAIKKANK